ncbi:MAG: signal recognition particle-docking protein FtsY [Pseudomonadota bacterium]
MAFFKKLRDRMFKSSSKLDQGLEAIVQDGGTEDAALERDAPLPGAGAAAADAAESPAEDRAPDMRAAQDGDAATETVSAPGPRPIAPSSPPAATTSAVPTGALSDAAPYETPPGASGQPAEGPAAPEPDRPGPGADATVDRGAPAQHAASEEDAARGPSPASPAALAPSPASADLAPRPQEPAPEDPVAGERIPSAEPSTPEADQKDPDRPGFFGRLLGRGAPEPDVPRESAAAPPQSPSPPSTPAPAPQPAPPEPTATITRRALDDEMLESLEELLIASDMGVDTALRVAANLAEGRMGRRLSSGEIKGLLSDEIARIMEPVAKPLPLYARKPQVVLVVGVNGSGKTTTIGKLASQFRAAGKSVVIAAGDTFRAAAVEQLQVWGDRAGVPVMTAPEGSDPASLAFDAMARAEADGADLLMIDTAGRLQNREDLMAELAKIVRVIRKRDPDAPHNTLLVLDATTGQNALSQVETFQKLADVSGLVMTKLDGTARGGVLVALADKFGLPIHAIGVGEQIDDLAPFDPEDFARALTGLDA